MDSSEGLAYPCGTVQVGRSASGRGFETAEALTTSGHQKEWFSRNHRSAASTSYEIFRGEEKLYWYDCLPHPHVPSLASTEPHHEHFAPDLKHNRVPARDLSFDRPNLPFLIEEIEGTLHRI